MPIKHIDIVVGANYGDEGKGQMTDYLAHQTVKRNESCIVVLHNGGAQRGHTVVTPECKRHVFHHFGSGTFVGVDTYLSEDFICNPLVFREEYNELVSLGIDMDNIKIYVNKNCRFSTPFDMMANQILEELRGENKHGSCGMGIWETIKRHKNTKMRFPYNKREFEAIHDYYMLTYRKEFSHELFKEWETVFHKSNWYHVYREDVEFMMNHCIFCDDSILTLYDAIIFEGAQGLALDEVYADQEKHSTPSRTGITNPLQILRNLMIHDKSICSICPIIYYVSRTYLTRHGAGNLENECSADDICNGLNDDTNIYNKHQGKFRYGRLSMEGVSERISMDINSNRWIDMFNFGISFEFVFTHVNEYQLPSIAHCLYFDGRTRENIHIYERK